MRFAHVALRSLGCAWVMMSGLSASGAGEPPIALAPANPHYFQWRGKTTILVGSGEHYGAVLNLDFDYVAYLTTLAADGLNHTRLFSGTYREIAGAFGITDNTLAPAANRYLSPWARSDRPGNSDGGNKFDLNRWDEAYFARLRAFMSAARERGVVVELNLFCPLYNDKLWDVSPLNAHNNVNGVGNCRRTEVLTLKHPKLVEVELAVTRKLATALREFNNVYFEVCNEPYAGNVNDDWQQRVIEALVEAERGLSRRHLISMNIANGRKKVDRPLAGVSILNFHYCVPPDAVTINYGLNLAIGENETGFRGKEDMLYRSEAWDFLLAGGALFSNLDYSFTAKHPTGTLRDYRSPGGGSPELRKQLAILKRFLDGFDLVRMKPDRTAVRGVSENLTVSVLSEPGKSYAIYLHVPLPLSAKHLAALMRDKIRAQLTLLLPEGRYRAQWIDTKTGLPAGGEEFRHSGGAKSLAAPEFANDIALKIAGRGAVKRAGRPAGRTVAEIGARVPVR